MKGFIKLIVDERCIKKRVIFTFCSGGTSHFYIDPKVARSQAKIYKNFVNYFLTEAKNKCLEIFICVATLQSRPGIVHFYSSLNICALESFFVV